MHIQEIIIDGFKSYATRTVVSGFDASFNAITGAWPGRASCSPLPAATVDGCVLTHARALFSLLLTQA